MEQLKYVGKHPTPGLQTLAGKSIDIEAYRSFEMRTFKELFRNQVILATRHGCGFFHHSLYKDIAPQFDSFESLLLGLTQAKAECLEVSCATSSNDEFLARVQVRLPVQQANETLFTTKHVAPEDASFVLVSFYTGVCKEFINLSKENELLKFALKDIVIPGALGIPNAADSAEDEAFDPNIVLRQIIHDMRLDRRYNYTAAEKKLSPRHFYHSPEGFIFRIEIDGYVATPQQ